MLLNTLYKVALAFILLCSSSYSFAQVTIGSSYEPSIGALLDLKQKNTTDGSENSSKGLGLPRVSLIALDDLSPCTTNTDENKLINIGLVVYNTTVDDPLKAGTYFWDGKQWQIFGMTDVQGFGPWYQIDNPTLPSKTVTTDSYLDAKAVVGGTTILNNATFTSHGNISIDGNTLVTGKIGLGNTTPNANVDIRPNPTSTTDPGESFIGIGTTTALAPDAGAGALRYSTLSGGLIEYSNGVTWNTLTSTVKKAVVTAQKITAQSFTDRTRTYVTGWEEEGGTSGYFNASTGEFTAPRDGNYTISFSYNFQYGPIVMASTGSQVEAILEVSSQSNNETALKKGILSFPSAGSAQAGSQVTFTFNLSANDIVRPMIWHSLGSTKDLLIPITGDSDTQGYINFSAVEL